MKNLKILLGLLLISSYSYAQPPTGTPPPNINNTSQTSQSAWYRGGNNPIGFAGTNNIFGTMWNSPIYTYTAGINRSRLNGTLTSPLNGVNQNVSGFMGLAPDGYFANNTPITLLY